MTRFSALRVVVLTTFAATAIGLAAGPALAKTSSPEKWGSAFCGSLSAWSDRVTGGAAEIQDTIEGADITPAEGKTLIVDFIGEIGDATGDFLTAMKKAGNPAAAKGSQIQKAIVGGIEGIERRVRDLEALAQNIPTTDLTSFRTSVDSISASFDSVSAPFDDAMDRVAQLDRKDVLSKRLQKVKACRALFG